ncbi:MAG: hypothetical protein KAI85_08545, partial [Halopseudomonas aestusnigri]|nr:hypothetical protein [Halopseudomonas aestusnigri]
GHDMSWPHPGNTANTVACAIYEPLFTAAPPLAMFKQLFDTGCLFQPVQTKGTTHERYPF